MFMPAELDLVNGHGCSHLTVQGVSKCHRSKERFTHLDEVARWVMHVMGSVDAVELQGGLFSLSSFQSVLAAVMKQLPREKSSTALKATSAFPHSADLTQLLQAAFIAIFG